jgi:hypothetical protein
MYRFNIAFSGIAESLDLEGLWRFFRKGITNITNF